MTTEKDIKVFVPAPNLEEENSSFATFSIELPREKRISAGEFDVLFTYCIRSFSEVK